MICTDTYLVLVNSTGAQVAFDDDACGFFGSGSQITFTAPGGSTDCTTYKLREGCFGTNTCSGTVAVYPGEPPAPTEMPTLAPTVTGKYSVARPQ